jgi:hypothetical protein
MSDDWIVLALPQGAENGKISHGDHEFMPYRADATDPFSPWLVKVPRHNAHHFCWNGGFRVLETKA